MSFLRPLFEEYIKKLTNNYSTMEFDIPLSICFEFDDGKIIASGSKFKDVPIELDADVENIDFLAMHDNLKKEAKELGFPNIDISSSKDFEMYYGNEHNLYSEKYYATKIKHYFDQAPHYFKSKIKKKFKSVLVYWSNDSLDSILAYYNVLKEPSDAEYWDISFRTGEYIDLDDENMEIDQYDLAIEIETELTKLLVDHPLFDEEVECLCCVHDERDLEDVL